MFDEEAILLEAELEEFIGKLKECLEDGDRAELIHLMVTISSFWCEKILFGISFMQAPFLVSILKVVGLVEIDGRTTQEVLVDYYHSSKTGFPRKRASVQSNNKVHESLISRPPAEKEWKSIEDRANRLSRSSHYRA